MKQSYFYGICLRDWLRLLREQGPDLGCAPRVAGITLNSVLNSLLQLRQATQPTQSPKAPIFILGHWRNGTTHLRRYAAARADLAYYAHRV